MSRGRQGAKAGRGKVVWSAQVSSKSSVQQTRRPSLSPTLDVPNHLIEHMIVGSLWYNDLQLTISKDYFCRPDYYSTTPHIQKGTLFIYAGQERVEESYGERKISLFRHKFIANGIKGIVDGVTFNYMSPVGV